MGRYPPFATFIRLFLVLVIFCSNGAALSAPSFFAHPDQRADQGRTYAAILPPSVRSSPVQAIYPTPEDVTPGSAKAQASISSEMRAAVDTPSRTELLALTNAGTQLWNWGQYGWENITIKLPQQGWRWFNIAASPLDPEHWLMWGYKDGDGEGLEIQDGIITVKHTTHSPIWRTLDGGETWDEVQLEIPSLFVPDDGTAAGWEPDAQYVDISWSEQDAESIVIAAGTTAENPDNHTLLKLHSIWYGSDTTLTAKLITAPDDGYIGHESPASNHAKFSIANLKNGDIAFRLQYGTDANNYDKTQYGYIDTDSDSNNDNRHYQDSDALSTAIC